ncbi:MAG: hypothetical protein OMM_00608 [Candidatus Magnetoglobus multicellularis str. Araruama]|uniref:Peptidase C1A papain C-terminal domain-containing protein n=1 Tax=Candidatus Magnetoglobus multicellularis str. Araruama TaxID=890399 RepID=A0A1V1PG83_9BACT|nr:MAG: hypothetical protein OMM_00608 [Candidatus Magnetoglobus multicellularis str. Araruama]
MKTFLNISVTVYLLLTTVFIVPNIFGQLTPDMKTAPINPKFLNYQQMQTPKETQQKRSRSRQSQKSVLDQGENLGLIPDPLISQTHQNDMPVDIIQIGPYSSADAAYDMRDPNHDGNFNDSCLPTVRNQGTCGACWAFAGYGTIESHLKFRYQTPDAENDFAEKHLLQHHGFDIPQCNGGNLKMIAAYLSRNTGPVLETHDPYTDPLNDTLCENCQPSRYFDHIRFMPVRSDSTDLLYIKNAILEHGALYTSILFDAENYYNNTQFSYYYDDPDNSFDDSNHAVVIVGWDDAFQIPEAPGNGAFIVRNSLGKNWGDQGYFYVSYYDESIARTKLGFFQDDIHFSFDVIYQYDHLGWTGSIGSGDNNDWAANVFTANEDIAITAIGFYATSVNMSYQIQIYQTFENMGGYYQPSHPLIDEPVIGTCQYSGFYTIKLQNPVLFSKGQSFAVVVQFNTPDNAFPIPIETPIDNYSESSKAQSSESFVSDFGNIFFDLQSYASQANVCIKAYGMNVENNLPIAFSQELFTDEDTTLDILLSGESCRSQVLNYVLIRYPNHGTVSGSLPHLTYSPDLNFNGLDILDYLVNDGSYNSQPARISITVNPVNDQPYALPLTLETYEDQTLEFSISGYDPDGDPLRLYIEDPLMYGILSGNYPNYTYIPNTHFFGDDTFRFYVDDGHLSSNSAEIVFSIIPVNDPPVTNDLSITTVQNTPVMIEPVLSDVDSYSLTPVIWIQPSNGTLIAENKHFVYTPNELFIGSDQFIFRVTDGHLLSSPATVSITVNENTNLAEAQDMVIMVNLHESTDIDLSSGNSTRDNLTYQIKTNPLSGELEGAPPYLIYTPTIQTGGFDWFTYTVRKNNINSKPATVRIFIIDHNNAPVAENKRYTLIENTPQNIILTATDTDNDPLSFHISVPPSHGTLSGTSPNLIYTPDENYSGIDRIYFKASDGKKFSTIASIVLDVRPLIVDTKPVANLAHLNIPEDTEVTFTLKGSDPNGDSLTYILTTQPTYGQITGIAPQITYIPEKDYHGLSCFTFQVSDGLEMSDPAGVTITISPVNDPPIADNATIITNKNVARRFELSFHDVDSNTLTFQLITAPLHGSISFDFPEVIYNPDLLYSGKDYFSYVVNDGSATSEPANVTIIIPDFYVDLDDPDLDLGTNPPDLSEISIQELSDEPIDFTLTDQDGGDVTITITSSNETLITNTHIDVAGSGSNIYTHSTSAGVPVPLTMAISSTADQYGSATITITAEDSDGYTCTTNFTVIVSPPGAGNTLDFDGDDDYIIGNYANTGNDNFTLEAWAKWSGVKTTMQYIVLNGVGNTNGYGILIDPANNRMGYVCAGINFAWISEMLVSNKWTHIAITKNSGVWAIYLDGVSYSISSLSTNTPAGSLSIAASNSGGNTFGGQIDEMRIWNTARTQEEIRDTMCKKLIGNETDLLVYYRFDHSSGLTLADLTGNGNNGTINNMDNSDWVTSGAAIGDVSVYDYTGSVASDFEVNLASSDGDQLTTTGDGGSHTGLHLYLINDAPYITTPPNGWNSIDTGHYWGIFPVGTDPTVSISYNYSGNTYYTDENANRLAFRQNNSVSTWSTSDATLNTDTNTFSASGYTSTEIILGQNSPPEISDIGLINTEISTSTSIDFTITFSESKLLTIVCLSSNASLIESAGITINQTNGGTYTYTSTAGIAEDLSLTLSPIAAKIGVSTLTMTVTTSNGLSTAIALTVTVMNDYQKVETGSETSSSGGFLLTASNISEYALLGHDGYTGTTSVTLSSGEKTRWNRLWYIQKNGAMDSTITFDFTDADIVMPGAQYQYCILKSTDTTGFEALSGITSTISGNQASFTLDDSDLEDDTYYTLAYNRVATSITLSRSVIYDQIPTGSVVGVLSNNDPDTDETHTYSFVSGSGSDDNNAFTIQGNQIKNNSSIDMDTQNSYNIRIRISDGNAGIYDEQISLVVSQYISQPFSQSDGISRSNATGNDGLCVGNGNVRAKIVNPKTIVFHRLQVK